MKPKKTKEIFHFKKEIEKLNKNIKVVEKEKKEQKEKY